MIPVSEVQRVSVQDEGVSVEAMHDVGMMQAERAEGSQQP